MLLTMTSSKKTIIATKQKGATMRKEKITGPDGKTFEMDWPETKEEWAHLRNMAQSRLNSPEASKSDRMILEKMHEKK